MVTQDLHGLCASGCDIGRVGRGPLASDRDGLALRIRRASLPGCWKLCSGVIGAAKPAGSLLPV